jgi:hypothetical protein
MGRAMNPTSDAISVLKNTKFLLQARGWYQGNYTDQHGRMCLVGAMNCAAFGEAFDVRATPADQYITRALGIAGTETIGAWNDTPGRTVDEVIGVIDMAISLAQQDQ